MSRHHQQPIQYSLDEPGCFKSLLIEPGTINTTLPVFLEKPQNILTLPFHDWMQHTWPRTSPSIVQQSFLGFLCSQAGIASELLEDQKAAPKWMWWKHDEREMTRFMMLNKAISGWATKVQRMPHPQTLPRGKSWKRIQSQMEAWRKEPFTLLLYNVPDYDKHEDDIFS